MTQPYPFQQKAIRKIDRLNGRCLLAHDMGLGKSYMSLLWYSTIMSKSRPMIVICPAGLKWNWQREAFTHLNMRVDVLESRKAERRSLGRHAQITVCNYDILGAWLPYLQEIGPKLIVIDEAQAIRNPASQRTKNVKLLCEGVPHVLALSGTPLLQRPIELYEILHLLRPDIWHNRMEFAFRHCQPRKTYWGWTYNGAVRLPELHAKMKREVMCRCRKEDVLDQLPPKARNVVLLDIERRKEYNRAEKEFLSWLREKNPKVVKRVSKVEQLAKGGYLKRLAAELKAKALIEWLETFRDDSNEKLLLFAVHRKMIRLLSQHFKGESVEITGAVTGRKRQHAIDKFLHDKKCRFCFGNIMAAGVGWSAIGVTNVGFAEFDWAPANHTQAEDRCHGIGRGREGEQTTSWWLVAQGTIEERLVGRLYDGQSVVDATLDGKGKPHSLDILDLLYEELAHA